MDNVNNANANGNGNSGKKNHYYGGKRRHNNHYRPREAGGEQQNGEKQQNFNRDNRDNGRRFDRKPREVETTDDIKKDIMRIEKELWLEISEISTLKLGI